MRINLAVKMMEHHWSRSLRINVQIMTVAWKTNWKVAHLPVIYHFHHTIYHCEVHVGGNSIIYTRRVWTVMPLRICTLYKEAHLCFTLQCSRSRISTAPPLCRILFVSDIHRQVSGHSFNYPAVLVHFTSAASTPLLCSPLSLFPFPYII